HRAEPDFSFSGGFFVPARFVFGRAQRLDQNAAGDGGRGERYGWDELRQPQRYGYRRARVEITSCKDQNCGRQQAREKTAEPGADHHAQKKRAVPRRVADHRIERGSEQKRRSRNQNRDRKANEPGGGFHEQARNRIEPAYRAKSTFPPYPCSFANGLRWSAYSTASLGTLNSLRTLFPMNPISFTPTGLV